MATKVAQESRKSSRPVGGNGGNGGNGHSADNKVLLVSQEIVRLVDASREGRLNDRGRTEQFDGVYREIIQGINEMLDAILLPIGEGNRILVTCPQNPFT